MKKNSSTILIISLLVVVVSQFFYYNKRLTRLRKEASIEAAKASFALKQFDNQELAFDSVYAKNDTVLFYKNDSFVGKAITVAE